MSAAWCLLREPKISCGLVKKTTFFSLNSSIYNTHPVFVVLLPEVEEKNQAKHL